MTHLVRVEDMNIQNMADALKARDEGMASSANHAESDAPGWGERAYQAIKWSGPLSLSDGFTMEEARNHVSWSGLDQPEELRAWGSVTQRLIRDGVIEPVGYARAASSNSSWKRTYRLVRP